MFNNNTQNIVFTSPGTGLGTSIYLIMPTGIIRAKTNANELHVRPGKNIYFIRDSDAGFFDSGTPQLAYNSGYIFYKPGTTSWIPAALIPGATYTTPADMYVDNNGVLSGGVHVGHMVTNTFNGACAAIGTFTIGQIIHRIGDHVNDVQQGNFSLGNGISINI